jgi:hypothetical protein
MTAKEALRAQSKFQPVAVWKAPDIRGKEYGHWEATDLGYCLKIFKIEATYFAPDGKKMFTLFFTEAESFLNWVKETL